MGRVIGPFLGKFPTLGAEARYDTRHKEHSVMKRFRLLGTLLVAVFATAMAMSAVAAADETPLNLPFKAGEVFTGKSEGEPKFISSNGTVACKEATSLLAENTIESNLPPLGKFQIRFLGCKDEATGTTCTGLGDTAGTVLYGGTWHLVWDEKGATFELTVALLFLIAPVHFNCSVVLIKLEGELLCLELKSTELSKTHSYHCIANGTTQEDSWCKKDVAGCKELVKPLFKCSVNEAEGTPCAVLGLGSWTVDGEAIAAMAL
jgi:hypothetical protein